MVIAKVADANGHYLIHVVTIDDFNLFQSTYIGTTGALIKKILVKQMALQLDNITYLIML